MRILALLPLLALAACANPPPANLQGPDAIGAIDWSRSRRMDVQLDDFHFKPETLTFAKGAPVTLVLINTGAVEHKFVAPRFFAQAVYKPGSARPAADGITLKAGERTQLELAPTRADSYGLECTETLHAMLGMSGAITVTP